MTTHRQTHKSFNLGRTLRKLALSAFVVFSFILYAAHRPFTGTDAAISIISPTPGVQQQVGQEFTPTPPDPSTANGQNQLDLAPTLPPTDAPTDVPQQALIPTLPPPTATVPPASQGMYKDGTYKGPEVDALYGLVQVQAVIQSGKIKSVQFLEYPNDRRTSVRINSLAVPYLQQEAVQAQSANVDIITGATLTSEAFMMSLQNALANAHS